MNRMKGLTQYICHSGFIPRAHRSYFASLHPRQVCAHEAWTMLPSSKRFKVRQVFTFITGMVECLFFAGIIFGWASLVFLLKSRGFFGSFCVNTTNSDGAQVQGQFAVLPSDFIFSDNFISAYSLSVKDRPYDKECPDKFFCVYFQHQFLSMRSNHTC